MLNLLHSGNWVCSRLFFFSLYLFLSSFNFLGVFSFLFPFPQYGTRPTSPNWGFNSKNSPFLLRQTVKKTKNHQYLDPCLPQAWHCIIISNSLNTHKYFSKAITLVQTRIYNPLVIHLRYNLKTSGGREGVFDLGRERRVFGRQGLTNYHRLVWLQGNLKPFKHCCLTAASLPYATQGKVIRDISMSWLAWSSLLFPSVCPVFCVYVCVCARVFSLIFFFVIIKVSEWKQGSSHRSCPAGVGKWGTDITFIFVSRSHSHISL